VGRRERFMRSNFESLSGAEDSGVSAGAIAAAANRSISNQYREQGPTAVQRNAKTIARAQSFRDEEQNRRREELQRRIEETRRKLQNVNDSSKVGVFFKKKISDRLPLHDEGQSEHLRSQHYSAASTARLLAIRGSSRQR